MKQLYLRLRAPMLVACVLPALSCLGARGEELGPSDLLCLIEQVSTPEPVSIDEGGSGEVRVSFRASNGCAGILKVTATSANGTIVSVTAEPSLSALSDPNPLGFSGSYTNYVARIPLGGLAPGGPVPVRVQISASTSTTTERSIPVTVVATKGTLNVAISGLPAGVNGNVEIGSVLAVLQTFTASGSGKFQPNTLPWRAASVNGAAGAIYDPTPTSGSVTITVGGTANINVVYALRPVVTTGTLAVSVGGVPTGSTGTITVTGPGVNQTLNASGSLTVPAGTYTVSAGQISTTNNDFNDPQPTRQVTVTAGQTANVAFLYAIIATLTTLNATGLEPGMNPLLTLTRGSDVRTINTIGGSVKLPIGTWATQVGERVIAYRTYVGRSNSPTSVNVLSQLNPIAVLLVYYCTKWQWEPLATFGVQSDAFSNQALINMLMAAHRLTVTWQFVEPGGQVATGQANQANQVTQETVTITGQGNFIRVSGTRASNGTMTLTGSGTIGTFTNVPAVFTGTLTNGAVITSSTYRLGQAAAPTGLPGGPITYTLTAPAPTAMMLAPLQAPPR